MLGAFAATASATIPRSSDPQEATVSDTELATIASPPPLSRRSVLKAGAWGAPVVAMAVATPLAAASTETTGWVAAVRIGNIVTVATATTNPGFRFGSEGAQRPLSATVTFTSTEGGLTFADVFNTHGTTWTWSSVNNAGVYTYTATSTFTTGPSAFNDLHPVPASTTGITIKGKSGTYSAAVTPGDQHKNATFTY